MFGEAWPAPAPDMAGIREPIDFLGINYYTRGVMRDAPTSLPPRASKVPQRRKIHTETKWEVYPAGLTGALEWVRRRYGNVPLYVTENGAAFYDAPASEDLEPDLLRVQYLREHVAAARRAVEAEVDLRGYFVWSLLDNFEWSLGFSKRFGIVHVDYRTQKRTPKASARFYAEVIRTNGVSAGRELPPAPSARRARPPKTSRSSRRR
jgi:beta-glucosidase